MAHDAMSERCELAFDRKPDGVESIVLRLIPTMPRIDWNALIQAACRPLHWESRELVPTALAGVNLYEVRYGLDQPFLIIHVTVRSGTDSEIVTRSASGSATKAGAAGEFMHQLLRRSELGLSEHERARLLTELQTALNNI